MIQLFHGDCFEYMKLIPNNGIDLILCDPPYGTTECKWDEVIPFDRMWKELIRVSKPNAPIILFGSQPFTSKLIVSNIDMFRYELIWDKVIGGNVFWAKKMPLKSHENILVFSKKQSVYNPQKSQRDVTNYRPNSKQSISAISNRLMLNESTVGKSSKYPVSIITCNRSCAELNMANSDIEVHPTQKPVALLEYLIKTYSNEDDTVLDFTMGSGSTGVACQNTNRRFIGIEKEEKFYNLAKQRMNQQKQLTFR